MEKQRTYIAIDLKSFYASVECVDRELDALTTNLVVADESRTAKTICLAVSPSLKAYGIPGRPRLFEVVQKVKEINRERRKNAPHHCFAGSSFDSEKLKKSPELELDYIIAPPQMARYMKVSSDIYAIYLKYVAPEDIHVYSIDEVFIDATDYIKIYKQTAKEFAKTLINDVLKTTGITATAGIAPNMFLCKVAMDIKAKHIQPDENGVRIAELDEKSYREQMWDHRPITDFWRVGRGYAKKLEEVGLFTMGDVARCSIGDVNSYYSEDLLYKIFGINAELLIDHAWGYEPTTIADIKAYKPNAQGLCSGQVLTQPYNADKAKLIVWEMTELLALDLVSKKLVTNQLTLTIGYDVENLFGDSDYQGEITVDRYGRKIPKHAHGTHNLDFYTSSSKLLTDGIIQLFERIVDKNLLVRRVYIGVNKLIPEDEAPKRTVPQQLDLFTDYEAEQKKLEEEEKKLEKERARQKAVLEIKGKYGKNAILKGSNFEEGATTIDRNGQVGGHKA